MSRGLPTVDVETLEPIFVYTRDQFQSMKYATIAASSLSLISSVIIITVYAYMLCRHCKEANRVSLRCVFLCSLSDAFNSILNIVITAERGEAIFCRAAGILIEFSAVLSTSLLTLVGINLVLIFVLNVKAQNRLEWFYYPAAFIYTMISITILIYNQATTNPKSYSNFTCWYLRYIQDDTYSIIAGMWFYAFIFFANLIAIVCSIVAMHKLVKEQRMLAVSMQYINKSPVVSIPNFGKNSFKKKLTKVLTKVVLRCIAYPLIPFIVNIFGFILQMYITTTRDTPSFALVMLDIIFACLKGVFIAFVFFTDPAVTSSLSSTYNGWYSKYVDEYTLVSENSCETFRSTSSSANNTLNHAHTTYTTLREKSSSIFARKLTSIHKAKMIPMRKFHLQHGDYIDDTQRNQVDPSINIPFIVPPPASMGSNSRNLQPQHLKPHPYVTSPMKTAFYGVNEVHVPYKHPTIATYIHYTLASLARIWRFFTFRSQ